MPNVPTTCVAVSPPHATVVLIDPEPLYRWFVAEALGGLGMAVVACASIDEALQVLRLAGPVDLLMVDGALLDRRGGGGLRVLRDRARSTPCVVLDADGDRWATPPDAVAIASKPVDTGAIATLVATYLPPCAPAA